MGNDTQPEGSCSIGHQDHLERRGINCFFFPFGFVLFLLLFTDRMGNSKKRDYSVSNWTHAGCPGAAPDTDTPYTCWPPEGGWVGMDGWMDGKLSGCHIPRTQALRL